MADYCDFDSIAVFQIEHAVVDTPTTKPCQRRFQFFRFTGTAGKIAIQTVENLHRRLAVYGTEISTCLRRPKDGLALRRRLIGHLFMPNSRNTSS
jgi:hypothetical protein